MPLRAGGATAGLLWLALMIVSWCGTTRADTIYEVKAGDTLWSIARRFEVPLSDLLRANDLSESSTLKTGHRLTIPSPDPSPAASPPSPGAASSRVYVVQRGDYIERIARTLGCPLAELLRLNGLTREAIIRPGQRLKVPDGEDPASAAPAPPPAAPAAARRTTYLYVQREDVILRSQPTTASERLAAMPQGAVLEAVEQAGGWWKVRTPSGREGYVVDWLVGPASPREEGTRASVASAAVAGRGEARAPVQTTRPETEAEESDEAYVSVNRAYVRREAGLDSDSFTLLARNTRVRVLDSEAGWHQVRLPDGRHGWMHASTLRYRGGGGPLPAEDGARIVAVAQRYLGTPYIFGGSSSRGTDCSGFVLQVFGSLRVSLPHSAEAQYAYGRPLQKSELQPGDLVFFKNTYRRGISHVGIYLGNDRFMHASSRRRRVRVDSLSESYYVRHYAGARRIEVPNQ